MNIAIEKRDLMTCEIGRLAGISLKEVQNQFHLIADYIDAGAIVTDSILLTGYFREPYK